MRLCPTHQNQGKTCSMGSVAEGGAQGTTPLWHVEGNQTRLGKGQGNRHYLSGAKCPGSWQFRSSEEKGHLAARSGRVSQRGCDWNLVYRNATLYRAEREGRGDSNIEPGEQGSCCGRRDGSDGSMFA